MIGPSNKGMKVTKRGRLRSRAACPWCSADLSKGCGAWAEATLTRIVFEDVRRTRTSLPAIGTPRILRSLFRILDQTNLCSIATVTGAHRPHINTAYFCASKQLVLYFLSHPNSQHCRNLSRHPHACVTVCSSKQPWGIPSQGVQLFGVCQLATGRRELEAERLYARNFPAYRRWRRSATKGHAGAEYRFYRLVVDSLKLVDEREIADGIVTRATVRRVEGRDMNLPRCRTRG